MLVLIRLEYHQRMDAIKDPLLNLSFNMDRRIYSMAYDSVLVFALTILSLRKNYSSSDSWKLFKLKKNRH